MVSPSDALNVLFKEFETTNKLSIKSFESNFTEYGHIINIEMYAEGLPHLLSLLTKEEKMDTNYVSETKGNKMNTAGNYSFFVKATDIVSLVEVSKCVSRLNPIAVIDMRPTLPESVILIHKTIYKKAELLDMLDEIESISQFNDIHVIQSNEPKKIIEWARKVKRASWPKEYETSEVRVIVPNI